MKIPHEVCYFVAWENDAVNQLGRIMIHKATATHSERPKPLNVRISTMYRPSGVSRRCWFGRIAKRYMIWFQLLFSYLLNRRPCGNIVR